MSFDHLHYVPIVRAKAGEFWALSHLKSGTKSLITPVFELVPHDSKKHTFASDLEKKVATLHKSWQRSFFFDVRHAAPKDGLPEPSTFNCGIQATAHSRIGSCTSNETGIFTEIPRCCQTDHCTGQPRSNGAADRC